ncbi:MAG TPA: helix-turn-helix domain-containing protein, partial [Tessaracoccus flavescens]|nr:helix-turn-helix domain-containing protein [Tessaracoccus flavescens]
MHTDRDTCLRAIRAKDPRFDGRFFTGVLTTGIYCRPSCPARTPADENVAFYPSAAAAQAAGFRACKRCLPGSTPGSPDWDFRADAVARAMRLIDDGVVDREGVPGLAARLGYSSRQVQRLLIDGAGASPLALARARRAQTARTLLEVTDLPLIDVATAAGFASLRSFNATMREVYAAAPRELRKPRAHAATSDGGLTTVDLHLPVRQPFCPCNVVGHLIAT